MTVREPAPPIILEELDDAQVVALAGQYLTPNYRNAPLVFAGGEGAWNITTDGRRFLDFSAGVAVNALGHGHPDLVAAIRDQAGRLIHQSNYWHNSHAAPLAAELCRSFESATDGSAARCFFSNSGAEAIEAAIKCARRYHARVRGAARPAIITAWNSFHGRTWAAMSATAQAKYQDGFAPLVPGFRHADFGDIDSIAAQIDDEVGAVLIEVVQGEGGVHLPPPGFFVALRELCDAHGLLLVLDEIQTGMGRTGTFFAFEQEGIVPDIVTLAKALGGGVPIGAMLARAEVAQALQPGTHASTFGANALACRAGRTVLAVYERDALVARAAELGALLIDELRAALSPRPWLVEVRGRGLMIGIEIDGEARDVVARAREKGLLLSIAGPRVLRFTPPLIVDAAQCRQAVRWLVEAADEVLGAV